MMKLPPRSLRKPKRWSIQSYTPIKSRPNFQNVRVLPQKRKGGESMVVYRNAIHRITLEEALKMYEEHDVCVVIDEGKHVTLIDEDYPLAEAR
jgi:hypothetical protein